MNQTQTLSILVSNESGVLTRVASLFGRRGFNIRALSVGETQDKNISRITAVVESKNRPLASIVEHLKKLVCVQKVYVLPDDESLSRELVLVKVQADARTRGDVMQIANVFRARVVDVGRTHATLELTGENDKTEAFVDLMSEFGILELARTGAVALQRGTETIYVQPEFDDQIGHYFEVSH